MVDCAGERLDGLAELLTLSVVGEVEGFCLISVFAGLLEGDNVGLLEGSVQGDMEDGAWDG